MSNKEEIQNLIKALSEDGFNELIVTYNKELYKTKDVYICNGPYDGGRDLIINANGKEVKINIQLTIQESALDKKISEDVKKAEVAYKSKTTSNDLLFFCNHHITQSKIDSLKRDALLIHGIRLDIYDNYRLANLATEYPQMLSILMGKFNSILNETPLKLDNQTRSLLDYLSMSYEAGEVKNCFLRAFILFYLAHNSPATNAEICEELFKTFGESLDKSYIAGLIGRIKEKGFIDVVPGTLPKKFIIAEESQRIIEKIEAQSQIDEISLTEAIRGIFSDYKIDDADNTATAKIIALLSNNYDIDIQDIAQKRNDYIPSVKKRIEELKNVVKECSITDEVSIDEIVKQIIETSKQNPFLAKCSAAKMLVGLFKSNRLERYLNTTRRTIIFDTQILLQIVCLCINEDLETDDNLYNSVRLLKKAIDSSRITIEKFTTEGYKEECVNHLCEAYKLQRFLQLPYISNLGKSKNVFFNYYFELKKSGDYKSFDEFISDLLNVDELHTDEGTLKRIARKKIREILEHYDIQIINKEACQDFNQRKADYEKFLYRKGYDKKSHTAIINDLNAIIEIENKAKELKYVNEFPPYLITWDSSFYKVRESFSEEVWHVNSPQLFANNISIANFKVNPEAFSNSLLLYLSENFATSNESQTFIDTLNELINVKNLSDMKLINLLAEMRQKQCKEIEMNEKSNAKIPIDEFLLLLQQHYKNAEQDSPNIADLSTLLEDNAYSSRIVSVIQNHLTDFKTSAGGLNPTVYNAFDEMLKERLD